MSTSFSEEFRKGTREGLQSGEAVDRALRRSGDFDSSMDIGPLTNNAPISKTEWHQSWVHSASIGMLLPALGDRIRTLFSDLSNAERSADEGRRIIGEERRERDLERKVLADSVCRLEGDNAELKDRLGEVSGEVSELRSLVVRGREAEAAVSTLRTVWLAHCQESSFGGEGDDQDDDNGHGRSDSDIVSSLSRALYAGRQALMRADSTLQKLVECEALLNMRNHELGRLSRDSEDVVRELQRKATELESVVAEGRSDNCSLQSELESAAELAERQGALSVTLEGRVEALVDEREGRNERLGRMEYDSERMRRELTECLQGNSVCIGKAGGSMGRNSAYTSSQSLDDAVDQAMTTINQLAQYSTNAQMALNESKARAELCLVEGLSGGGTLRGSQGLGLVATQQGLVTQTPVINTTTAAAATNTSTSTSTSTIHNSEIKENVQQHQQQQPTPRILNTSEPPTPDSCIEESAVPSSASSTLAKQRADMVRMQQKYNNAGRMPVRAFALAEGEQSKRIERLKNVGSGIRNIGSSQHPATPQQSCVSDSSMTQDTPQANNRTGASLTISAQGRSGSGSGKSRPPSPGTAILQERLRRAQANFNSLTSR